MVLAVYKLWAVVLITLSVRCQLICDSRYFCLKLIKWYVCFVLIVFINYFFKIRTATHSTHITCNYFSEFCSVHLIHAVVKH